MKKNLFVLLCLVLALAFVGCQTTIPVTATGNSVGPKVGEATSTFICGLLIPLTQDSGIRAAAKNGKISKISTVDLQLYYIGPFYIKLTTVVTGE